MLFLLQKHVSIINYYWIIIHEKRKRLRKYWKNDFIKYIQKGEKIGDNPLQKIHESNLMQTIYDIVKQGKIRRNSHKNANK
jgi:hypothetical protein